MKILFVLPRMVAGGVERVTLSLIRGFQNDGHECALALRHAYGEFLVEAQSLCQVYELAPHGLYQFVPNLARLIRTSEPTHIVTAFADVAVLTWMAMRIAKTEAHWVHGVHNTHALIAAQPGVFGHFRFWLDGRAAAFVYRRADKIVAVSNGVREEILHRFVDASERVITIYNPVVSNQDLREVPEPRHDPTEPYSIVALGRLVRQKGFDILIEAMTHVPGSWRLDIWGEGEDRQMLQALIADRCLQDRIQLRGYTANPLPALRHADLFVLSSRWEGFGVVLVEALACQCQIVATDCPQGPREILEDGKFGQLVPSGCPDALGSAIMRAISGRMRVEPILMLRRASAFSCGASCAAWSAMLGAL